MAEYKVDELTDNSKDKKKLYKARKERYSKKRRAVLDNGPVKKWGKAEPTNGPVDVQPRPPPPKMRPLGPYYTCREYGHLERPCNKSQQPYPFMNKSYYVCHNGVRCPGSTTGLSVLSIEQWSI